MDMKNQQDNLNEEIMEIENNNEEVAESKDNNEKSVEVEENNYTEIKDEPVDRISFKDTLLSSVVDAVITGTISVVALYIFDIILRSAAGYFVKEKVSLFVIIYLLVTILYTSIMESSKNGNTIGKRAANLKITKIIK